MPNRNEAITAVNQILRGRDDLVEGETRKLLGREDNTALIPSELHHDLDKAKIKNNSMRKFIDVVPVNTPEGQYATEDESNKNDELTDISDEGFEEAEQELNVKGVRYKVKPYASFTPMSTRLVNDSAYDLHQFFVDTHSEKATKTENKKVFSLIKSELSAKELEDTDELKDSLNEDLKPSIKDKVVVITNQDGFKEIKSDVEYFKSSDEKPKPYLDGYPVEVYDNDELSSDDGKDPVIYGALEDTVKLFDYEDPSALVINNPYGMRKMVSIMRGIEKFDVKLINRSSHLVYGEIDKEDS